MTRPVLEPIELVVDVDAGDWPDRVDVDAVLRRTVDAADMFMREREGQPMPPEGVELSLLLTDDAAMRAINLEWRGQDKPTNVLSFPGKAIEPGQRPLPLLGDIVLAFETILRESQDLGKNFEDHLAHLVVHGYLHLLGHDHMNADDAERMEALERRILATLGLPDPYGDAEPLNN